jgi:myo-inositol 2-dehydrogenase / D-chiro-inositol 1-dehydrogenase
MSLSLALLGAGRIGRVHAQAIAATPGARLVAVADALPEAAQALAAAHGCAVRSIAAIATSPDVDAVAICTPTDTHADLIAVFARAGKPIFCEKPVDLSLARVRACLEVVTATGTPLMIGFNRRFDPHFAALKAQIDAGAIGAVEQVQITSRDPGLPHLDYLPRSGGLFRDMTIHDFDMARHLLGEDPAWLMATATVLVDPQVAALGDVDTAMIVMQTASGRQAVITNSRRASYGYDQRIEVHGAAGMVQAVNVHTAGIITATAAGFVTPPLQGFFMDRYAAAYAAEIAAFLRHLAQGTAPAPSGQDGLMALAMAEAAQLSVARGTRVALAEVLG